MEENVLCSVILSALVSEEEIDDLTTALRVSAVKVERPTSRVIGIDEIALYITIAGGTAQLIDYSIKVAKAINNWRRKIRQKGESPEGKLEDPRKTPLDLRIATDEEVEEWLSR
jgi:hypothetical protein